MNTTSRASKILGPGYGVIVAAVTIALCVPYVGFRYFVIAG